MFMFSCTVSLAPKTKEDILMVELEKTAPSEQVKCPCLKLKV